MKTGTAARAAVFVAALFAAAGYRAPAGAESQRFAFRPGDKSSSVEFLSKAPMETFSGRTNQVTGYVVLDPAGVADTIEVDAEVPLATLDTGIEMRNQHMREEHLETDHYPTAVFRGGRVVSGSGPLEPGKAATMTIAGTFDLHGVTKTIEVPVNLTWTPGSAGGPATLRTVAKFDVKLADYNIKRPSFLVMKLDEVQHITFDVTAIAASP